MSHRLLVSCLLLAACGTPVVRRDPLVVGHVRSSPARVAAPAARVVEITETERPSWLDPAKPGRRVVTSTSITILDQIAFIGPSPHLDPISYPMLDAVVATLDGNPSIRVLEVVVSGNDAPERWQQDLGDRRAQMIVQYMVHRGADRARLRARGVPKAPQVSSFVILQRD